MQLFFVEGFFFPLLIFNQNILMSAGRSGLTLKIDIIKKVLILLSILIVWRMGIEALIIGQVTATVVALVLSSLAVVRLREIKFWDIGGEVLKLAGIVAVCLLVNYGIIEFISLRVWLELTVKCTVVPLLFYLLAVLFRLGALNDLGTLLANHTGMVSK